MSEYSLIYASLVNLSRARPLPPEERRAALVEAALPLVREHGMSVTTRQLAQASGVAEGTIFRVFPDKDALIHAAIDAATDPERIIAELARIDPTLPLRERLVILTRAMQTWLSGVISLMMAIRPPAKHLGPEQARQQRNSKITNAVAQVIEADAEALRVPVADVVRTLRALVFASSHPMFAQGGALTAEEVVDVLLDGVIKRAAPC